MAYVFHLLLISASICYVVFCHTVSLVQCLLHIACTSGIAKFHCTAAYAPALIACKVRRILRLYHILLQANKEHIA